MAVMYHRGERAINFIGSYAILAKGNPGALSVIGEVLERIPRGGECIERLAVLNIMGSNIWIAYKDICKESALELVRMTLEDSQQLVDRIQQIIGYK